MKTRGAVISEVFVIFAILIVAGMGGLFLANNTHLFLTPVYNGVTGLASGSENYVLNCMSEGCAGDPPSWCHWTGGDGGGGEWVVIDWCQQCGCPEGYCTEMNGNGEVFRIDYACEGDGSCTEDQAQDCSNVCDCPQGYECIDAGPLGEICQVSGQGQELCGDEVCEGEEDCSSCPSDCACETGYYCDVNDPGADEMGCVAEGEDCGDEVCSELENCCNCELDCGECECGDGTCLPCETAEECPTDCGGSSPTIMKGGSSGGGTSGGTTGGTTGGTSGSTPSTRSVDFTSTLGTRQLDGLSEGETIAINFLGDLLYEIKIKTISDGIIIEKEDDSTQALYNFEDTLIETVDNLGIYGRAEVFPNLGQSTIYLTLRSGTQSTDQNGEYYASPGSDISSQVLAMALDQIRSLSANDLIYVIGGTVLLVLAVALIATSIKKAKKS